MFSKCPEFDFDRDDIILEVPLNKYKAAVAIGHIHFNISKVIDDIFPFDVKRLGNNLITQPSPVDVKISREFS